MKAFLLAAGLGTRLRPLTDTVPKCLVPIDGVPLLDIWLNQLAAAGVDEVLVNLHHLPELVTRHLSKRPLAVAVRTSYEPTLLGSAGTLRANRDFVAADDMFLAVSPFWNNESADPWRVERIIRLSVRAANSKED